MIHIEAYWYAAPIFIWGNGAFLAGGEQSISVLGYYFQLIRCDLNSMVLEAGLLTITRKRRVGLRHPRGPAGPELGRVSS